MKSFSFQQAHTAEVFQISPSDTNYFAVLFDKAKDQVDSIFVIEIFNVGGATPPNSHTIAHEFFFVLAGEGIATSNGEDLPIRKGDSLLLRPGSEHVIRNTGTSKLYTLTVMTPNEGFAELIRSGTRCELDDEDLRVLGGVGA